MNAQGKLRADVLATLAGQRPADGRAQKSQRVQPGQRIYLEGAAQDQFFANIGARKIYEVLKSRPSRCTFYEPPGRHADHVRERLQRGLQWVFDQPLTDIK